MKSAKVFPIYKREQKEHAPFNRVSVSLESVKHVNKHFMNLHVVNKYTLFPKKNLDSVQNIIVKLS